MQRNLCEIITPYPVYCCATPKVTGDTLVAYGNAWIGNRRIHFKKCHPIFKINSPIYHPTALK
jgi:hypothetical protein